MTKSYVTIEKHVCPVCGTLHDTGSILLDKRLKERFEHNTVTGLSLCPEHLKLHNDGYVALVEIKDPPIGVRPNPQNADRTGKICHLKRTAAKQILDINTDLEFVYVDSGVIPKLQTMQRTPND